MPEISNSVVVESLVKRFGDFTVDSINLEVRKGEGLGFLLDRTARENPPQFVCCAACSNPHRATQRSRDSM